MSLEPPPDPDLSALQKSWKDTLFYKWNTNVLTHLNIHFWIFNMTLWFSLWQRKQLFSMSRKPFEWIWEKEREEKREKRKEKKNRKETRDRREEKENREEREERETTEKRKGREERTERQRGKMRQKIEGGREAGAGWYATVAHTKCVMRVCAGVSAHTCLRTSIYNVYSLIINSACLNTIPCVDNNVWFRNFF